MEVEIEPELLKLCGYVQVHQLILGDGQAASFNLVNGWDRLAMTSQVIGGGGSALGESREVTIWGTPGSRGEEGASWRYDLSIHVRGEEVAVMAMRSLSADGRRSKLQTGTLVALDPPTPMEMLAAQARVIQEG
tara:strand:- start:697 stop:1098 length:402 start_codon:yes stop_codon:yes gene_type:complete